MLTLEPRTKTTRTSDRRVPILENGDHLSAEEFLRRYEAMPDVKKAELINGVVYMASPVRATQHAAPDSLIQTWIGWYAIATPGTSALTNPTVRLDKLGMPQPDASLRLLPEKGGKTRIDKDGYLSGPPELVVEIAASTSTFDSREKMNTYRRAGVTEYLIWCTEDETLDWLALEGDEYRPLTPGDNGILRSRVFPGLWLDWRALLQGNGTGVMDGLKHGLHSDEHERFIV